MINHFGFWKQLIKSLRSVWYICGGSYDSPCWEILFCRPGVVWNSDWVFEVDAAVDKLIEWAGQNWEFGVGLSLDPELSVDSVNFKEHFVFGFEEGFRNDLGDDLFGLFEVKLKQVKNSVETVWVGERWLIETWESWNEEVEDGEEFDEVFERMWVFLEGVVHDFFHGLFAEERTVQVPQIFFRKWSLYTVKSDLSELMSYDSPVDMFGPILNTTVNFPEEFKFIEFLKIIDILEDFLKAFAGDEEVAPVIDFDGLNDVEAKMVGEIGLDHLFDDFEENVGGDAEVLELVVTVDLLDGLHVVWLQDLK